MSTETPQPTTTVEKKVADPKLVQEAKTLLSQNGGNKSDVMRRLADRKVATADIARILSAATGTEVRYQFVRSVVKGPRPKAA